MTERPVDRERRREEREPASGNFAARILYLENDRYRYFDAQVINHSRRGAQLITDSRVVKVGMEVTVMAQDGKYIPEHGKPGEIVWVTSEGGRLRFGCEFAKRVDDPF